MKIGFDYQIFSLQAFGGISRYYVSLAEQLRSMGQSPKIFAPFHCNEYLSSASTGVVDGKRVASKNSKLMRLTLPVNHLVSNSRAKAWAPDVLHETYFSMFKAPRRSCPTVLTVYDMVHEKFPEEFSKWGNISVRKRAAVERADHVICISESTRNDLIQAFGVDESKVSVVYLGFDTFADVSVKNDSPTSPRRPYLLFVGNRAGYKNFHGFLRAFARSSALKADYDVACFGGGAFTVAEKELIHSLGLSEDCVSHQGGSDKVLGDLYSQATAFVYPSMYEGFGLPPLEAMAKGCPVIVSHSSSMPEVVGEAGCYFDPHSIEDMSCAMEKVVFSSSLRQSMVSAGYNRLQKFSWASCAEKTMDVYTQVMR
ncbi:MULTISPECIES: glycosyltransferase family 4 protein [Pseudomonas]|uniref:glycosyltransferase family 4 protein n=1 Tax=Pseudomonas TaxID=286 RepID=UPI00098E8F98|nr:glycosyltransferase family 1 protein [Pseudomonas azotoformans]AQT93352.1 glycosyl transferase family 1 [Pseudomonas azotoformans]UMY51115.1 glycosyltransferase family 4 protein [Pseudomonas azotoformans]